MNAPTRKEMIDWVFQQILEGLCSGEGLHRIAVNLVDGIANMTSQGKKAKP